MAGTREIKRRIKSIGSTKKITRAMQMVSAVKMRKAQVAAVSSRSYADFAWQIISNLSRQTEPAHSRLLGHNPASKKLGILLITSNRGLVGSLNSNLIAHVAKFAKSRELEADLLGEVVTLGKKGRALMLRMNQNIFAEFEKTDRSILMGDILPISRLLIDEYSKGTYREIVIAYTHFNSTIKQTPTLKQLLPFTGSTGDGKASGGLPEKSGGMSYEYLFEPDPAEVLSHLLPRIIESQIYQAVLESDASEHSARMVMMKNATDAASDLITDLTLAYNQLRQANITQELAELTAGRIALE